MASGQTDRSLVRRLQCMCGESIMYIPQGERISKNDYINCPFCNTPIARSAEPSTTNKPTILDEPK